jgi:uncharacterized membrane protein
MRIFGHPVHLMLIHFPAALLPMELVCYGIFYFSGDDPFAYASYFAMVGACISGWLAIFTGIGDLLHIPPEKTQVMRRALLHAGINSSVILVYTTLCANLFIVYPDLPRANGWLLAMRALLVCLMFFGNYLGGILLLKDRIGIEK